MEETAAFWRWNCALIGLITAGVVTTATDNSCSTIPWNETICCTARTPRQEGLVRPGAENTLSVLGCEPKRKANITLLWNYSDTLTIEGYSMERLYIFSICDTPTTFSEVLHPSVNTILYDSNMHHRVSISSTIVSQPLDSACTYFGCYGAFRGFYYYTFSEVPCIVAPTTTHPTTVHSTLLDSQASTTVYFTQQPKVSSYAAQQHLYTATTQSPLFSPMETLNGFQLRVWYILLLLSVILTVCGAILGLIVANWTRRKKHSYCSSDMDWQNHLRIHRMHTEEKGNGPLDKISIHSVHTVYEELVQTSTA